VWSEHWGNPNNPFVPCFLFSVDGTHCAVFERQTTVMKRDEKCFSHKFSSVGVMHEVAIDVCHSWIVHIRGPFPAGKHDKAVFMEALMGKIPPGSTQRHCQQRMQKQGGCVGSLPGFPKQSCTWSAKKVFAAIEVWT